MPGFIDIQVNGAYGVDFSSCTEPGQLTQGLAKVKKLLLQQGVTAFCPTIVSSLPETYAILLPQVSVPETVLAINNLLNNNTFPTPKTRLY